MLNTLFIINLQGEVFFEKHWRGVIGRQIADHFFGEVSHHARPEDVPPVLVKDQYFLVHILKNKLFFLGVLSQESSPALVLELLQRCVDNFEVYFETVSESTLKNNFVCVYELLDEMIDNGFPLTMEPNILVELIKPPTLSTKVKNLTVGGTNVQKILPESSLSSIPWRRTGVKYTSNEIYFDIVEELEVTIDANGQMVNGEVQGKIECNCRLSGLPDLTLSFTNPQCIDSPQFHPCVRYHRWEADKVFSFIPPDGRFRLCSYRARVDVSVPIYVTPQISFNAGGGRIEFMAGIKPNAAKTVEDVVVLVPFQAGVDVSNIHVTEGRTKMDTAENVFRWEIGKMTTQSAKTYSLTGSLKFTGGKVPDVPSAVQVQFKITGQSVSQLKVDSVICYNESYKMYKGVRSTTKAGKFYVRT